MSDRTIQITITNHSSKTLTQASASKTGGSTPSIVSGSLPLATGKSLTISADGNHDVTGVFTLADESKTVSFAVTYCHPHSDDPTTVSVPLNYDFADCQGWPDQNPYSGHDVIAAVNLYDGVTVRNKNGDGTGMNAYVVPLASDPYSMKGNCQDLANSLFAPNVRSSSVVQSYYDQGSACPYLPADFTGGQVSGQFSDYGTGGRLVQTLLNFWPGLNDGSTGSDQQMIHFLANYLVPDGGQDPLVMHVPNITYNEKVGGLPAYKITGYTAFPFATPGDKTSEANMANVKTFLMLLCSGAHFVAISADEDFKNFGSGITNTGRDLYTAFRHAGLAAGIGTDPGNSHYTTSLNGTGLYYGMVDQPWAPPGSELILSLLFGQTVNEPGFINNSYNTFMQLEGWQANTLHNDRHMADYAAYQASLWNISTYGACPYSEKRGTTIFLAPAAWFPTTSQVTLMMPYVGAYAQSATMPQPWLDTSVVWAPDAAPLASKYIG